MAASLTFKYNVVPGEQKNIYQISAEESKINFHSLSVTSKKS